jgi:hypothetical protein
MSAPSVVAALAELQSIRAEIAKRQAVVLPVRGIAHATAQTHAWADTLRDDHLKVLASYAKSYLTDDYLGKPLRLRVPHKSAGMGWLVNIARQYDPILRPHLPLLVEKGMPRDLLDKTLDAANQIAYWYHTRPERNRQQKGLREEIDKLISQGRESIERIRLLLGPQLRANGEFAVQFETAVTPTEKPGPPRDRGWGTNLKRRRRPSSHEVAPVRLSDIDTPEQDAQQPPEVDACPPPPQDPPPPGPSDEATGQAG